MSPRGGVGEIGNVAGDASQTCDCPSGLGALSIGQDRLMRVFVLEAIEGDPCSARRMAAIGDAPSDPGAGDGRTVSFGPIDQHHVGALADGNLAPIGKAHGAGRAR